MLGSLHKNTSGRNVLIKKLLAPVIAASLIGGAGIAFNSISANASSAPISCTISVDLGMYGEMHGYGNAHSRDMCLKLAQMNAYHRSGGQEAIINASVSISSETPVSWTEATGRGTASYGFSNYSGTWSMVYYIDYA